MKVLLVRPDMNKKVTGVRKLMFGEPSGIECVSAILKELGHEVLFVDFMIESSGNFRKYLEEFQPDAVGLTSVCSDISNVLYFAQKTKEFREKITVIVGGVQAVITPEAYFGRFVDYVFKATTRENYRKLMEQIGNDTDEEIEGVYSRKLQYQSPAAACEYEYIKPDRDISLRYRKKYKYCGYQPCAIMQTSFGCRNHCLFCIRKKLEGRFVERPMQDVLEEIMEIREKNIMISDNDFLIDEQRLITFCDLLEEKKIQKTFICYGSTDSILEKEYLFERLSANGLKAVIIGLESFSDKWLKLFNKNATVVENNRAVQVLKKNGIAVWANFILHPDYTKEDFSALRKYLKCLRPEMCSFTPLVPHFLTPLYEQYKDRLIYPKNDYERWSFGDVIIYPSAMSLRRYYFEVLRLGIPANFNITTTRYCLRTYPMQQNIRLFLGFDSILGTYIKCFLRGGMDNRKENPVNES